MSKRITPESDPMAFMDFLTDAPIRFEVCVATTGKIIDEDGGSHQENWHTALNELDEYLGANSNGRYWVGLGTESVLTDDYCQLAVYLEDPEDEATVRRAYRVF